MKLHCSQLHAASDMSDEQVLTDQQELPGFERGLFEVDARDSDEVLPYNEPFMEHVKAIATFDNVRAVPPDPTRRSVGTRGVNVQWRTGSIRPSANGTTSRAPHFTLWSIHESTGRRTSSSRPPMDRPYFLLAMQRKALQKLLPAWWQGPVSACCRAWLRGSRGGSRRWFGDGPVFAYTYRGMCASRATSKEPLDSETSSNSQCCLCAMDALVSEMDTLTVFEPPRCDACEQGKSAAVGAIACSGTLALADDATPAAEQEVPLVIPPSKAVNTVGVESRRVAAARKLLRSIMSLT